MDFDKYFDLVENDMSNYGTVKYLDDKKIVGNNSIERLVNINLEYGSDIIDVRIHLEYKSNVWLFILDAYHGETNLEFYMSNIKTVNVQKTISSVKLMFSYYMDEIYSQRVNG